MAKDDVLVVNATQMKIKTAKSGRQTTYAVTKVHASEPITINLNDKRVSVEVALAIAEQARAQTKSISAPVKESTMKARRAAYTALLKGKRWALDRYGGGRTGVTFPEPNRNTAFYSSGRLANGIVATYREQQGDFAINYPANRWNPKHWSSPAAMQVAFDRWIAAVPVLQDPRNDIAVQRALRHMAENTGKKHSIGTMPEAAVRSHMVQAKKEESTLEQALLASLQILEAIAT